MAISAHQLPIPLTACPARSKRKRRDRNKRTRGRYRRAVCYSNDFSRCPPLAVSLSAVSQVVCARLRAFAMTVTRQDSRVAAPPVDGGGTARALMARAAGVLAGVLAARQLAARQRP